MLNSQHLRSIEISKLVACVKPELERAASGPFSDEWLANTLDPLRARFFTLHDSATRGRAHIADDFRREPDAMKNLEEPGAREGLRKPAARLAADKEFAEAGVKRDLRTLAEEPGVKAGTLIDGAPAASTGQPVRPGAFHLFTAMDRERAIARLRAV